MYGRPRKEHAAAQIPSSAAIAMLSSSSFTAAAVVGPFPFSLDPDSHDTAEVQRTTTVATTAGTTDNNERIEPLYKLVDLIASNPSQFSDHLSYLISRSPPSSLPRLSRSHLHSLLALSRFAATAATSPDPPSQAPVPAPTPSSSISSAASPSAPPLGHNSSTSTPSPPSFPNLSATSPLPPKLTPASPPRSGTSSGMRWLSPWKGRVKSSSGMRWLLPPSPPSFPKKKRVFKTRFPKKG